MQKESPESYKRRLQEEQERQAEYEQVEVVVVSSDVREARKIFPASPKSPGRSLSFSPKVVFMPHCMFEEEEKEAELAELRMQECSDDEEEMNTPRHRPKRHSFGDAQDAPLAPEAPRLEVQTHKSRHKSEKFKDRLSRARLAKTREKARELGDEDYQAPSSPSLSSLGDVSFDEKLGRVTDKYSRARLARMHRSATGGTLARVIDAEFMTQGRSRSNTPYLELHVRPPTDETSTRLVPLLRAGDVVPISAQLQALSDVTLQRCELDDAMVSTLALAIEASGISLSKLDLSCNLFGDPGAKAIGNLLKVNSSLTSLDLNGNDLKDPSSIGEGLKVNRGLQSLFLIDCPITQNASDIVSLRSILEVQILLRKGQVGTTIHLDSATTLSVPVVEAQNAVRWYVTVEQPDPVIIHQLWSSSSINLEDFYRRSPKSESLLYALIPQLRLERPADKELIKFLAISKVFAKFNSSDVSYRDMCPPAIRTFIDGCTHFCGRFLVHHGLPEYEDNVMTIFRATDSQIKAEVLLVLFHSEARYRHERLQHAGLDPTSALQIIFSSDMWPQWKEDVQRLCGRTYPWGVVMPAYQRPLFVLLQQEPWSVGEIKRMLRSITKCLQDVHSTGRVHGNVTPRHIVRMADKSYKLMGLEAMTQFGVSCGTLTASAYWPPELALLRAEGVAPGLMLSATASFDIWGLGVVMFRMLRRASLFCADDSEELWGAHARTSLENWSPESLAETLHLLHRYLRPLMGDHDRLAACDLLGALLQRQVHLRPSSQSVLNHAFLQPADTKGSWFMSADHVSAALESVKPGCAVNSTQHHALKTPLHLAVENGRLHAVQSLLEQKASLDCKDICGRTPLEGLLQSQPHEQLTDSQLRMCQFLAAQMNLSDLSSFGFSASVLHKLRQLSGPQMGDTLRVRTNAGERVGVVKFLGPTSFAPDEWIGIDLGTNAGKNDGSVKGVSYFTCAPGHGIFVQQVAVLENLGKVGTEPAKTPEVRGECDICHNPVTTDDQRMKTADGSYRHLACQPLPDLSALPKIPLMESNMLGAIIPPPAPPLPRQSSSSGQPSDERARSLEERERLLEERERQLAERERGVEERQKQLEEDRKSGRPRKPSPSPTRPVAREGVHLRPAVAGAECEFVARHGVVWGGMLCAKCGVRRKDHRLSALKPPEPRPKWAA